MTHSKISWVVLGQGGMKGEVPPRIKMSRGFQCQSLLQEGEENKGGNSQGRGEAKTGLCV